MFNDTIQRIQIIVTRFGAFTGTYPVSWDAKKSKFRVWKKDIKSWAFTTVLVALIALFRFFQLTKYLLKPSNDSFSIILRIIFFIVMDSNVFIISNYLGFNARGFAELGNNLSEFMDFIRGTVD
jgi:hypothetical protein